MKGRQEGKKDGRKDRRKACMHAEVLKTRSFAYHRCDG